MKNRSFIITAIIVIGLVYLINAQEKAPVPTESGKPVAESAPVKVVDEKPATEAIPALAKPVTVAAESAPVMIEAPAPMPAAMAATPASPESEFVALPEQKDIAIPGATVQFKTNETLSIALDDVEMIDVIRMFTRLSKANIIATPSNLTGRVTVNLSDVEWKPALTSILDMHNLGLVERTPGSGVFSIVPKQPGAPEPLIVETIFLKYASVSNVESVVRNMAPAPGSVSTFSSRNALVIRATSAQMSEIKNTLTRIDTIRDQVFIEAKFMELNDEAIKDLGINWKVLQGYSVTAGAIGLGYNESRAWSQQKADAISQWDKRQNIDGQFTAQDNNGVAIPDATLTVATPLPPMTYSGEGTPTHQTGDLIDKGKDITRDMSDSFTKDISDIRTAVLGAADFQVILSALKQMNGVSVVSNPKIMVANEEPATIHIGEEQRPFTSSVTPGQQGIAPVITYNPGTPVQLGVKLTVTPTINTESNITVKIEPELTRIKGTDTAPNGQTYPIVSTKKIKTVFCLESGKTVAIGGLTETSDRDKTTKIPLLGDIPLIGKYLFSHTSQQKGQTETIIFVTVGLAIPESIGAETGLPEDSELVQRKMMESKLKRQKYRQAIEKRNDEVNAILNADSEKAKSRLLKMSK